MNKAIHSIVNPLLSAFLNLFFRLLYHELAWTYDWVAAIVSLGRWHAWVLSTLPYLSGQKVLEIGHGSGHLQCSLRKRGIWSIGMDESKQMNKIASTRLSRCGINPFIMNGYAQYLPFPSKSFHQVVATFPTEYIFNPNTLGEVYRVLTDDGVLVVVPFAWITGRRWYDRLAAWLFRVTDQAPARDKVDTHFIEPFQNAGFKVRPALHKDKASTVVILLATKRAFGYL